MRALALPALLSAALMAAGCATQTPPVQVTRFHLGQPLARGDITVEPRDRTQAGSLEFQRYAGIVQGELRRVGFTPTATLPQSELVAVVDVMRGTRAELAERSGFTLGMGGGSFGRGVGVGAGFQIPIGRRASREVVLTGLSVQLKRKSDGTVVWEGRAQGEARGDDPNATPDAAVARLAHALFTDFPGESGRTITVK